MTDHIPSFFAGMESKIKDHYHSDHLTQRIKTALINAKKDLSALELKDLFPVDQLHTGGARSSLQLFNRITVPPDAQILDAGCGTGGSARLLADHFKCRVEGIDLADNFIEAATFLTDCTRHDNFVSFHQGSVLDLPFENNRFDAVLCQHILMNIKDKPMAAKEFFRVLKPGGKLLVHEITKGNANPLFFPVPWAAQPCISFLEPWEILSRIFKTRGFMLDLFSDETHGACAWWERVKTVSRKTPYQPDSLGPGLIFGKNAALFGKNMHANFKNNAICLVEAIFKKKL